jgi:glycosyltransferase involved in cell wall biosynthesis
LDNKTVLIISHGMIPFYPTVGGVIRMISLANFLDSKGFKVYIISAKGEHFGDLGKELNKNIEVIYIQDLVYSKIMKKYKNINENVSKEMHRNLFNIKIKKYIKFLLEEFIIDIYQHWNIKARNVALDLIRKKSIKNVIITSPPHSVQLIGYYIKKKKPEVNLIIDFRDAWNLSGIFSKKTLIGKYMSKLIEKKILKKSNHIVYVSNYTKNKIQDSFNLINKDINVVMNGYEKNLLLNQIEINEIYANRPDAKKLKFGFFGSISNKPTSFRNPDNFFKALSMIDLEILQNIKLDFFGNIDINFNDLDKNIKKITNIYHSLPHKEAIMKMAEYDGLLIFHSESKGAEEVFNGKLFEYMSIRKPIILCGTKNMFEARYLVETLEFGKFLNINDIEDIKNGILNIYEYWISGRLSKLICPKADLRDFSREKQYEQFLKILS